PRQCHAGALRLAYAPGGHARGGATLRGAMAATVDLPATASTSEAALRLDFRSDTITQPTPEMRQAMAEAAVGDDVFGEDPSINELEAEAARIFQKEAGLFLTSGTQGNLLAMLSLTRPGDEVIAEVGSHIA